MLYFRVKVKKFQNHIYFIDTWHLCQFRKIVTSRVNKHIRFF